MCIKKSIPSMEIKEVEIPVPWGKIAAKTWGNENCTPVIAIHGVADNACSFDQLIPLLPNSFYYICIDLPSHGKSTLLPSHLFISPYDMILGVKFVADYLNKKKYVFMGHSWGAQISVFFAQLFPEYTVKIITLDAVFFSAVGLDKSMPLFRKKVEGMIQTCNNTHTVEYEFNEAKEIFIKTRKKSNISPKAIDVLLGRSLVYLPSGRVRFAMDPRILTCINFSFDPEFTKDLLTNYPITCPILVIICNESKYRFAKLSESLNLLQKQSQYCIVNELIGSHYLHMINPEIVAAIVTDFLNQTAQSKL